MQLQSHHFRASLGLIPTNYHVKFSIYKKLSYRRGHTMLRITKILSVTGTQSMCLCTSFEIFMLKNIVILKSRSLMLRIYAHSVHHWNLQTRALSFCCGQFYTASVLHRVRWYIIVVQGPSGSSKLVPINWKPVCNFLLIFNCNYVPIFYCFWDRTIGRKS